MLAQCAELKKREVILHLPKFRFEPPAFSLATTLQALGMKSAFDLPRGSANFERMAAPVRGQRLYISEVAHKTFIAVDEKGTEASAATVVRMLNFGDAPPPDPVEVRADRPFLFAVQHRPSGACLFLGRVANPAP